MIAYFDCFYRVPQKYCRKVYVSQGHKNWANQILILCMFLLSGKTFDGTCIIIIMYCCLYLTNFPCARLYYYTQYCHHPPKLCWDGCYRIVLNKLYHIKYRIWYEQPDVGGAHVLVGVTQVPCLTVHGHDQVRGLWKVQYTHIFVDDVRIFKTQLLNFLLVWAVEVIQDVSQLVHLVAELGWVL